MLANTERDDQKETARTKHDINIFTDPRKGIEKVQKTESIKWDPRHMLAKFQVTARIMDYIKLIQKYSAQTEGTTKALCLRQTYGQSTPA